MWGVSGTASTPSSSSTVSSSEPPALIDLAEPVLFGKARCIRGTAAYPSSNPVEWLSDSHLANAHAVDERPIGTVRVTYNYPRDEASVPNIFGHRPVTRLFQQRAEHGTSPLSISAAVDAAARDCISLSNSAVTRDSMSSSVSFLFRFFVIQSLTPN